jgi:hypothetical protein
MEVQSCLIIKYDLYIITEPIYNVYFEIRTSDFE